MTKLGKVSKPVKPYNVPQHTSTCHNLINFLPIIIYLFIYLFIISFGGGGGSLIDNVYVVV